MDDCSTCQHARGRASAFIFMRTCFVMAELSCLFYILSLINMRTGTNFDGFIFISTFRTQKVENGALCRKKVHTVRQRGRLYLCFFALFGRVNHKHNNCDTITNTPFRTTTTQPLTRSPSLPRFRKLRQSEGSAWTRGTSQSCSLTEDAHSYCLHQHHCRFSLLASPRRLCDLI